MQHVSYAYVKIHIAPMYVDVSEIQQVRWCMLNTNLSFEPVHEISTM